MKVLFLTLQVFSATGGIEKVCRVAGKALYELGLQYGVRVKIFSMYGRQNLADGNEYFPQELFTGFNYNRVNYVLNAIKEGRKQNIVLLSHINLLFVGYFIKLINPSTKLYLIAHGIEVWKPLSRYKKMMLRKCDGIIPVSRFTKKKMEDLYQIPDSKFTIINNCLDPFLEKPLTKDAAELLRRKYGLNKNQPLLLSVSRMVSTEKYKGYDKVIEALPTLLQTYPDICYMLIGKYDEKEKQRLDNLIESLHITGNVIFTGFLHDSEMAAHFSMADIFVMPSEKEGFGIVFIEAMYYGLPVIAGNKDGSVDALLNGEIGLLVNPDDKKQLQEALFKMLSNPGMYRATNEILEANFGYKSYKLKLGKALQLC